MPTIRVIPDTMLEQLSIVPSNAAVTVTITPGTSAFRVPDGRLFSLVTDVSFPVIAGAVSEARRPRPPVIRHGEYLYVDKDVADRELRRANTRLRDAEEYLSDARESLSQMAIENRRQQTTIIQATDTIRSLRASLSHEQRQSASPIRMVPLPSVETTTVAATVQDLAQDETWPSLATLLQLSEECVPPEAGNESDQIVGTLRMLRALVARRLDTVIR